MATISNNVRVFLGTDGETYINANDLIGVLKLAEESAKTDQSFGDWYPIHVIRLGLEEFVKIHLERNPH